jgi:hypothetical protein
VAFFTRFVRLLVSFNFGSDMHYSLLIPHSLLSAIAQIFFASACRFLYLFQIYVLGLLIQALNNLYPEEALHEGPPPGPHPGVPREVC